MGKRHIGNKIAEALKSTTYKFNNKKIIQANLRFGFQKTLLISFSGLPVPPLKALGSF